MKLPTKENTVTVSVINNISEILDNPIERRLIITMENEPIAGILSYYEYQVFTKIIDLYF